MPRLSNPRTAPERTALFADFHQLYSFARSHYDGPQAAFEVSLRTLADVRRYLAEGGRASVSFAHAYANFGSLHANAIRLQEELLEQGFSPRYTRILSHEDATAALTVDVCGALRGDGAPDTIVLVTATNALLPLVEHVMAQGVGVLVVHLGPIEGLAQQPAHLRECYLDVQMLAGPTLRRWLESVVQNGAPSSPQEAEQPESGEPVRPAAPRPETFPIEGDLERLTLELIEEHFGQYDEVYLTPLLRKLSEILGDEGDPKEAISALEAAGAVWLEKRRGFPYDYTVLLVNDEHEDVLDVRAAFEDDEDDEDEGDDDYWEDDEEYDDDEIDEADESEDDYDDDLDYVEEKAGEEKAEEPAFFVAPRAG